MPCNLQRFIFLSLFVLTSFFVSSIVRTSYSAFWERILGTLHLTKTSGLNFWQLPVANGTAFSRISKKKKGQPHEVYPNFPKNFFSESFLSIQLCSRIFGWMVRVSEIQQFPEFLETFSGNFSTIYLCFQISKVLVEWKAPLAYCFPSYCSTSFL